MEHTHTNISLPGYYICDSANRRQDSDHHEDQQLSYNNEKVTEMTSNCMRHI